MIDDEIAQGNPRAAALLEEYKQCGEFMRWAATQITVIPRWTPQNRPMAAAQTC